MSRLDVSVIPREERAVMMKEYRKAGFSNQTIRNFMDEEEEYRIDERIGAICIADASFLEQLKFARPYVVARMVRKLRLSTREAEQKYDFFVSSQTRRNVELAYAQRNKGKPAFLKGFDERGREDKDEIHQFALSQTTRTVATNPNVLFEGSSHHLPAHYCSYLQDHLDA